MPVPTVIHSLRTPHYVLLMNAVLYCAADPWVRTIQIPFPERWSDARCDAT